MNVYDDEWMNVYDDDDEWMNVYDDEWKDVHDVYDDEWMNEWINIKVEVCLAALLPTETMNCIRLGL